MGPVTGGEERGPSRVLPAAHSLTGGLRRGQESAGVPGPRGAPAGELASKEALLLARDAHEYLSTHLLIRGPGQIELPAIAGRTSHTRRGRSDQPERLVTLSVLADEDAGVLAEWGMTAMVTSRLVRIAEEAFAQDALLDAIRLCLPAFRRLPR